MALKHLSKSEMRKPGEMASSSNNPFRMPPSLSEFAAQDENKRKMEQRQRLTLKVHEKGLNPRGSRQVVLSHFLKESEEDILKEPEMEIYREDTLFALQKKYRPLRWNSYHMGSVKAFAEEENKISRLKYSTGLVQRNIQDLIDQVSLEEQEMEKAEYPFTDTAFAEYIKKQDKKKLQAQRRAKKEAELLQVTMDAIWRTEKEIAKIKEEISKYKRIIKDDQKCREFLWKLSPPEWREQQEARMAVRAATKAKKRAKKGRSRGSSQPLLQVRHKPNPKIPPQGRPKPLSRDEMLLEDRVIAANLQAYEKPQIYFTDPKQLLNLLSDMDTDTAHLFEKLDCAEEIMSEERMIVEMKTAQITKDIDHTIKRIEENKARISELQEKLTVFKMDKADREEENTALEQIIQKIQEVHSVCIGCPEGNPGAVELLTAINMHIFDLLKKFDSLPEEELKTIMREYYREKTASAGTEDVLQEETPCFRDATANLELITHSEEGGRNELN